MARAAFRSILPSLLDPKIFDAAFERASRAMEKDVKGAFMDSTSTWKNKPVWRGYVRLTPDQIYISVGTNNEIFKFIDEGTKAHFIKPVRAKMLHWVDPVTGEDAYSMGHEVKGITARHISRDIREVWLGLMPDYFDAELVKAIRESGHAI